MDKNSKEISIIDLAEMVLGDYERSVRWLETPSKLLDDKKPIDLLNTEDGADEVRKLLLSIEHSVYS